jgi:hypothetical protein
VVVLEHQETVEVEVVQVDIDFQMEQHQVVIQQVLLL